MLSSLGWDLLQYCIVLVTMENLHTDQCPAVTPAFSEDEMLLDPGVLLLHQAYRLFSWPRIPGSSQQANINFKIKVPWKSSPKHCSKDWMWKFQEGWKGCLNLFHCIFPIISSGTSSILSFLSKSPFSFSHWFIFPSVKRPGPRILKKLLNIKTFKTSSLNLNLKHNIAIHSQDLTASIISGPCRCARPASGNPSLLRCC